MDTAEIAVFIMARIKQQPLLPNKLILSKQIRPQFTKAIKKIRPIATIAIKSVRLAGELLSLFNTVPYDKVLSL